MFSDQSITTIDLLRHGECEGGEIFRGSTDVALTEAGWRTMQLAAEHLHDKGMAQDLVCSPLRRCREFAGQLAAARDIRWVTEEDLREMHFGDWEGMEVQKVWRQDPVRVQRLFTDAASFEPPNGESMLEFQRRVLTAWTRILARYRNRHLLLVIHGGTIRILLTALLGMPLDRSSGWHVPYGCCSRLRIYQQEAGDRVTLVFHNGLHSI